MRRLWACGVAMALLFVSGSAMALSWTWVDDPTNDATGSSAFQIYGMGYAFDADTLYYSVRTNFPESGVSGYDSYGGSYKFSPGDLRINAGGDIFGLAFTTHANVVPQAYPGTWPTVTKGRLYTNAVFADATYEGYEAYLLSKGITPVPTDGNLYDGQNTYPTLIKGFASELTGVSSVQWVPDNNSSTPWVYEITGSVKTAALGLDAGEAFDLFWTMECGNDAVKATGVSPIPEPSTVLLLGAGLLGLGVAARRKLMA